MSRHGQEPMSHPAWIEIDVDALAHNARVIRRVVPAAARMGLLVKANGYGHGLANAASAAIAGGADQLIAASLDEGLALRGAGIDTPILIVYPVGVDELEAAAEAGIEVTLSGAADARRAIVAWTRVAERTPGHPLAVHLEVDTGMGRGGIASDGVTDVARLVDAAPSTRLVGIWSHLADDADADRSAAQQRRFETAIAAVGAVHGAVPMRHVAATGGVFLGTAHAYDMVRVGLGFYGELGLGVDPAGAHPLASQLRPAMAVKALPIRIEEVPAGTPVGYGSEWTAERTSIIATLPVGYADGWTRAYWPGASALVRGRRVPLVGRVSMDAVCADVTDAVGDGELSRDHEFVLLGEQGNERITPNELAALRRSIPNEVFCAFGGRLRRVVVGADTPGTKA